MAQQTQEKTIYLILGVLVLVIILLIAYSPKIIDWFKQLPGYEGDEDRTVLPTADDRKFAGGCVPGESLPAIAREGKEQGMYSQWWIHTYDEKGNEQKTDLYFALNGKEIILFRGITRGDKVIGTIDTNGRISINPEFFSILTGVDKIAAEKIHNSYLTDNNYICKVQMTFKCQDANANAKVSQESIIEYNKYQSSFEKYSTQLPSQFKDISSFKALLVAFAQKEKWGFDDLKINLLSEELKDALSNNNDKYPKYMICNSYTEGEKIMCIASVYNQGEDYKISLIGTAYARDIISYYKSWQSYFCGDKVYSAFEKPKSKIAEWRDTIRHPGAAISVWIGNKDKVIIAFDFLKSKGFTSVQTSGIIGNLIQESGLNPYLEGDKGTSIGIAQWHNERKTAVINACPGTKVKSKDSNVINNLILCQLNFLYSELQNNEKSTLMSLQNQITIKGATISFQNNFERCGDCRESNRIAYAQQVFNKMVK